MRMNESGKIDLVIDGQAFMIDEGQIFKIEFYHYANFIYLCMSFDMCKYNNFILSSV